MKLVNSKNKDELNLKKEQGLHVYIYIPLGSFKKRHLF
jgi:hypothetical protein